MENQANQLGNVEVFKLASGDIDHLFRRSGLKGNRLSAHRYDPEQAATSRPSELFKTLAESPQFGSIARKVLEPDLKIEFNRGGGSAAEEQFQVLLSKEDPAVVAQFVNAEGYPLLLQFENWRAYLEWWSSIYASPGMGSYQAVFPEVRETEVLVSALHCIDIYRRSYMESMLDYRSGVELSLSSQDFVQILKKALASRDKRWLLPTLFELTPGLKNIRLSLQPAHIQQLQELGFATSAEGVLTLGERARLMGTEFITSWMGSVGFQATALIDEEERSLSRVFLATTAFTNHLFSFENQTPAGTRFRHQALIGPELEGTLLHWMEEILAALSGGSPAPAGAGEVNASPAQTEPGGSRFCGQCGAELRPGKKFCTACGTPI